MKVGLTDDKGKKIKELELEASVFEVKANIGVVHQVVKAQLAGIRAGSADTKTRSEVRGGGKKPWRQKGSGRARAGSNRSPVWKGGGTIFGPTPRSYGQKVPKKIARLALRSILSEKARNGDLLIVEKMDFAKPATKAAAKMLDELKISGKVTVVVARDNENAVKSIRNLPAARVIKTSRINAYDLVDCEKLLMTKEALEIVTGVLAVAKS